VLLKKNQQKTVFRLMVIGLKAMVLRYFANCYRT